MKHPPSTKKEEDVGIDADTNTVLSYGDDEEKGGGEHHQMVRPDDDRSHRMLKRLVIGMGVLSSLLVGYILGATITASHTNVGTTTASLFGATDIDAHTGIAYVHAGQEHPVLKTDAVMFYSTDMDIAGMANAELLTLKEILLDDDQVKFVVKGYGRGYLGSDQQHAVVHLIVEGGTLTWDVEGIVAASGETVNMILDSAFPPDEEDTIEYVELEEGVRHRRRLPASCKRGGRRNGKKGTGSSNGSRSF